MPKIYMKQLEKQIFNINSELQETIFINELC